MIKELLTNKTAKEKSQIKSSEIAKLNHVGKFTRGDLEVEIISLNTLQVGEQHGIELYARAWDKGEQIGFVDGTVEIEHFRIFNPPILVPDGTKSLVERLNPKGELQEFEEDNYKEDLTEAVLQSLEHAIKVTTNKLPRGMIVNGRIGNTTSTFYPDGTGSNDVSLFEDTAGQTWGTKVAAPGIFGNQLGSNANAILYVAAHTVSGQWNQLRRGVTTFETAAIDSGDTVSAAVLSIWGKGMYQATMTLGIAMDEFLGSNTDTWDGTEYGILATFWASNRFGTSDISNSSWTNGSYNDFTMSTFTPIKKGVGAVTRLGLRLAQDIDNSTPTWASGVQDGFKWSGYVVAGTTNDPKLVVTHAAAAAAAANLMLLGVGT